MITKKQTIGKRERDYTFEVGADELDIRNSSGNYLTGKRYETIWNNLDSKQRILLEDLAIQQEILNSEEGRPYEKEY
jgi:hypothetical protein